MATPMRSPLSLHNENVAPIESPMSIKLHYPSQLPTSEDTDAPPPPPPPPATVTDEIASDPVEALSAAALPILFNEHPLSLPIWVGGNAAVMLAYVFDLNPLNAASWALLACVMKGFAVSVVSPPVAPPPNQFTAEQLAAYLAPKLEAARGLRAKIFGCTDPRLALRAALALYAATIVSSRVGTPTLLWTAANLAFAMPAAIKAGTLPKVAQAVSSRAQTLMAHQKVAEAVQSLRAHPHCDRARGWLRQATTPKAQIVGGSLLWFFCLSWMHKALVASFVCLHLKAQGHISPTTEMQVGEAVDQIKKHAKKHARRMSLAVRRVSEPPNSKDE